MQRRPELYPPPSEKFAPFNVFSPERWDVWQPKSWHYIPFNGGPRICIGQQFALTEMGTSFLSLLACFWNPNMKNAIIPFNYKRSLPFFFADVTESLVTAYTIVRILQRFERVEKRWVLDGGPLFKSEIVLSPRNPVKVGFWEPGRVGVR